MPCASSGVVAPLRAQCVRVWHSVCTKPALIDVMYMSSALMYVNIYGSSAGWNQRLQTTHATPCMRVYLHVRSAQADGLLPTTHTAGTPVITVSSPFGAWEPRIFNALRAHGIISARLPSQDYVLIDAPYYPGVRAAPCAPHYMSSFRPLPRACLALFGFTSIPPCPRTAPPPLFHLSC